LRLASALCLSLLMFFARKRSANAAAQQRVFCLRKKRSGSGNNTDVGLSVVATGRGVVRLSFSISASVFGHLLK